MPRKFAISLLCLSILLFQAIFFSSPLIAAQSDVSELAAMLPESDIMATIDADRILNVAAPSLLGQDAQKIAHLRNLLKTIENQIGINPSEIRQIAAGLKLPPAEAKDFFADAEFTVIVRTQHSNADLLETWSKKIDAIVAFKNEQAASRKYMDAFKQFRDFKTENVTSEKIAAAKQTFEDSLKKTREIDAALNGLPKAAATRAAISNVREKNREIAATLNNYAAVLRLDGDSKTFRESSIKLLNRWNAVTIDDSQKTVKLGAILKESKDIYPAYKKKYDNAKKLDLLLGLPDPALETTQMPTDLNTEIGTVLDEVVNSLKNLPAAAVKKNQELNTSFESLDNLKTALDFKFEVLNSDSEVDSANLIDVAEIYGSNKEESSLYEMMKREQREEIVNEKRMLVFDVDKEVPNIAVGFLDDKTMVVGFKKTITPFLKHDANYKNSKAVEMLDSSKNSLLAFAMNSAVARKIYSEMAKKDGQSNSSDVASSVINKLAKDINVYGSVNYDFDGGATNDITMSLGFFRDKVGELQPPEESANAKKAVGVDDTFEIAGYQVGKDIFYDLFNSFKAVRASMTFQFEKKKVAALIRATPRMIDRIRTANSSPKKEAAKNSKTKSNKLESIPDLLTTPQLYIDLAALFTSRG